MHDLSLGTPPDEFSIAPTSKSYRLIFIRVNQSMASKGQNLYSVQLSDVKIVGGKKDHLISEATASIENHSAADVDVEITADMYYKNIKIGIAVLPLHLKRGKTTGVAVRWQAKLLSGDSNKNVQAFVYQYLTSNDFIDLTFNVTSPTGFSLDLSARFRGLGSQLVTEVDVYCEIATILQNWTVSCKVKISNPLDTEIKFCTIKLETFLNGGEIAFLPNYNFEPPWTVKKGKAPVSSDKICNVNIVKLTDLIWTAPKLVRGVQQLITSPAKDRVVRVNIISATVLIDEFCMEGLEMNLENVPFNLHLST